MAEALPKRRCAACYFCRELGGTLHCVRNPPELNRKTGEARWPCVQPTDICGAFRCCDGCPLESDFWPRHDLPVYTDRFGDYCKIPLTKGQFAKVDPEDYIWLAQFRWHCKVNKDAIYAVRCVTENGRERRVYLHRLLMDTPPGKVCDHMNHDGLDDRKFNLRNCTTAQNNANRRRLAAGSSKYVGVSWDKRRHIWVAHIKINGVDKYLGSFDVEEDAARAHDAAAWAQHGPFANLNFPEDYPDHPAHRFAVKSEVRNSTTPPKADASCPVPFGKSETERRIGLKDRGRRAGKSETPRTSESGDGNGRVGSQPTREGPCGREPRNVREQDKETRRMGFSPCGSKRPRAKTPRTRRRATKGKKKDSSGAHTKARSHKGRRDRKMV